VKLVKKAGEPFGVAYGANEFMEFIMPFPVQILTVNSDLFTVPEIIISDPYSSWFSVWSAKVW